MRYVAAALLAALGGTRNSLNSARIIKQACFVLNILVNICTGNSIDAKNIEKILSAVGVDADSDKVSI